MESNSSNMMTWREEARPLRAQKRRERGEGACNIRRVEIS
jgi:hypothetical protein